MLRSLHVAVAVLILRRAVVTTWIFTLPFALAQLLYENNVPEKLRPSLPGLVDQTVKFGEACEDPSDTYTQEGHSRDCLVDVRGDFKDSTNHGVQAGYIVGDVHHTVHEAESRDRKQARLIVESLAHSELERRIRDIEDVSGSSREWMFQAPETKLARWLKLGSGTFWLRGKAGSGKSVLMKFIAQHQGTYNRLLEWADGRPLITAHHFFWATGTSVQSSVEGLLLDLLHQILGECSPETIQTVVSQQRWQARHPLGITWSKQELRETIHAIIASNEYRICAFIDGLDECRSTEVQDLVTSLAGFTLHQNFKMIASSRPWPIFDSAFATAEERILLKEFNLVDIAKEVGTRLIKASPVNRHPEIIVPEDTSQYTPFTSKEYRRRRRNDLMAEVFRPESSQITNPAKGFLRPMKSDEASITRAEVEGMTLMYPGAALVFEIAFRAEGVFLWARLVADTLCERMRAPVTWPELERRLDQCPREMDLYFMDHIVARVHGTWIVEMAMALRLMELPGQDDTTTRSFLLFWLLSADGRQSGVSITDPPFGSTLEILHVNNRKLEEMCEATRQYLSACTKDLLHVSGSCSSKRISGKRVLKTLISSACTVDYFDDQLPRVEYMHRTVAEFLASEGMQRRINDNVPDHFLASSFPAQAALARLQIIETDISPFEAFIFFQAVTCRVLESCPREVVLDYGPTYETLAILYLRRLDLEHDRELYDEIYDHRTTSRDLLQLFDWLGLVEYRKFWYLNKKRLDEKQKRLKEETHRDRKQRRRYEKLKEGRGRKERPPQVQTVRKRKLWESAEDLWELKRTQSDSSMASNSSLAARSRRSSLDKSKYD